jgi:hypothetical protein
MHEITRVWVSIPDIQSAFSGGGDGSTRFKLEAPESELAPTQTLQRDGRGKAMLAVFFGADSGDDVPGMTRGEEETE